jgi:hypothetical protein
VTAGAGHDPALAAGHVHERDLRGGQVVERLLARDRQARTVRRPREPIDIESDAGQWGGDRRSRLTLRATPSRDRRVDQPHLTPSAASRDERETTTVR